jgi:short-subunit dehydrogenase
MIGLLCFVLAVLASPFKSKLRLEAENAVLRHQLIVLKRRLRGRVRLTNIVALTALTRLFLGPMLERNCGRILNVASVAAFMPVPNLAVYAASKAYVLSFGDALFQELSGTKITVTTLCPGVTDTGMVHGTSLGGLPGMMVMDAKTVAQEWYRACTAARSSAKAIRCCKVRFVS